MNRFHDLLRNNFVFMDGATGTMLPNELLLNTPVSGILCLTHPELITGLHKKYLDSGSNIICANTFGVYRNKLAGSRYSVKEVTTAAVGLAHDIAAEYGALTALDIGPTGELLEPLGAITFNECYEMFRELIIAGTAAGADIILIETMSDLAEARCALLAAKENSNLPVILSMTFEENGHTFSGCTAQSLALLAEGMGADAVGVNCSRDPAELLPVVRELAEATQLPIMIKPNAGLPDPSTGLYNVNAKDFAAEILRCADLGVQIFGGCCGTTPEYLREIITALKSKKTVTRSYTPYTAICSTEHTVKIDRPRIIGERLNPTGKKLFRQALLDRDMDYVVTQAVAQEKAGAEILDVNVGIPGIDEPSMMSAVIRAIQGAVSLPLCIDSADPLTIEAGLRAYNGIAIVNSVNGDDEALAKILPLVKKYGACVVGLTIDKNGLPADADERLRIAQHIINSALKHGIPREKIIIDCLTLAASVEAGQTAETLKAIQQLKETDRVKTLLGVSNISFGLPERDALNSAFLSAALFCGLDLPIMNPHSEPMMKAFHSSQLLYGADKEAQAYISQMSRLIPTEKPTGKTVTDNLSLETAVERGLKAEARQLTGLALKTMDATAVVNGLLIPALDKVGAAFERGDIFLPQLLRASAAAEQAFNAVKQAIAAQGGTEENRGEIVLATVEGDIHDIGKNIVKAILENYGYRVYDLGRNVPAEEVVTAAVKHNIRLVGLSALMTTTLKGMQRTIALLKENGHDCRIMVGGAVLTKQYAHSIGADYYARDAKAAADIAHTVFNK